MGIKKLTAKNAVVKTASVEVKILTISGKQVTLAVFRQIVSEEYPAQCPDPEWPIWGWVNYHHSSTCSYSTPHRHIVWQAGTELRKCVISEPWASGSMWTYCTEVLDQLFIAV